MTATVEGYELASESLEIIGATDIGDVTTIHNALVEIAAMRRSQVLQLLVGADRASLVAALDRAESALRRRLAV
ncbi:MAG: hypothetical protein AB7O24_28570 [Kofleriaceae bacterium]